jgi:hypothetical protein
MALRSYLHSTFDPRRIPGLESWWDAADAASVTLDEGRVSQLADKSGRGRHAANTTSGSTQPSYITAGRNGLNVARFAAASVQRLTVASSTAAYNFLHNGTDSWIAAVNSYGITSDPGALHTLMANNAQASANTGFALSYDDRGLGTPALNNAFQFNMTKSVTGFFCANNNTAGNTGILDVFNNVFTPNTLLVQECVYDADNATADQRVRLRINGGSEIVGNNKTETPSTGDARFSLQLGAAGNNNFPLTGDICELLIFSQIPTAAARDLIRRYLGQKWGVSVA